MYYYNNWFILLNLAILILRSEKIVPNHISAAPVLNLHKNTRFPCCCFLKFFCWTKVHFVGPLIVPVLDFMWPSPWVSKPGWFSYLHTYLNLRVISGATPAFSINRGAHCISVYTAGPPCGHPSCKQWRAGNSGH